MATCEDCIHNNVCTALEEGNDIDKCDADYCGCFKDKSKWQEVKHGHWIKDPESGETRCSECDWSLDAAWESNYCPDCGVKMYDKEDEQLDKIINIGDRVVMAHPEKANIGGIKAGSKGYVLAVNVCERLDIYVDWDDPVYSDTHDTNFGYRWWVNHESLELENAGKENKFKVGDRVIMAYPEKADTSMVKARSKGRVLATDDCKQLDVFVDWDDHVLSLSDTNGTNYGCKLGHGWWVSRASLELENTAKENKPTHVIVMKYDGTTTTAFEKVNNKIVAKAEAHRHPNDFASSSIGFKLAFERLMNEVAKEDENKKKIPKPEKVWKIDDINVGDLVELRDDLVCGEFYDKVSFLKGMEFTGLKAVVARKDEKLFRLENDYWYTCEMVKQVYQKVD